MKHLFLFTLVTLISLTSRATIYELNSLKELNLTQVQNAWVIFDIDNTVLKQTTMIGTHQWGDYMRARFISAGYHESNAFKMQHEAFSKVQNTTHISIVEDEFYKIFQNLIKYKVPTFALTARPGSLKEMTIQQLKKLNVNFQLSSPAIPNSPYATDGVLFSGNRSKGEVLVETMSLIGTRPSVVYMIDDKRYNLEAIEKSLQGTGIQFVGYRYGAADKDVSNFDSHIADLQWLYFRLKNQVLSNYQILNETYKIKEEIIDSFHD